MNELNPVKMLDEPAYAEAPGANKAPDPRTMKPGFVMFATPSLANAVCLDYFSSAMETTKLLMDHGYENGFQFIGGDPYLAKVRNYLGTLFLKYPNATHLFFLDDDLTWDANAALRLIQADKDVIAGIYPKKQDIPSWPCELMADESGHFIEENGLLKAKAVPTGFLCIKRHVMEKVAAVSGRYRDINGAECINFFQMGFHLDDKETGWGSWWGEDYAWCNTWIQMGGEIWVDPNIQFGHRGAKTWRGNFADAVKAHKENPQYLMPKQTDSAA